VESVATPKGPRQKTICSLGDLSPRPREEWLKIARKMHAALAGQEALFDEEPEVAELLERAHTRARRTTQRKPRGSASKRDSGEHRP
jgi:hypothetical protein